MEEPMYPLEFIAVKEEVGEDIKCNFKDLHRSINIKTEKPVPDEKEHYAVKKEAVESIESNLEDVQSSIEPYAESGNEKFPCTSQRSVGLIAKLKNQLKIHLSASTEFKRYPKTASFKPLACKFCLYRCCMKQSMTRHVAISHSRKKPFLCQICDYKCSMKQYLTKHMKTHSSEKPFACSICLFRSAHKDALRSHVKVHTGKIRVYSIP